MNAAVLRQPDIGLPAHPNELDRRRIERALGSRKRYRYVSPIVRGVTGGYLVESPCCSRNIDAEGGVIGDYDSGLARADLPSPSARFALMVLSSHSCVDFFGLVRRDALKRSLLHGSFHGADRAFLAQMALRGRFVQLTDPLVEMREHGNRYTRRQVSATQRLAWHDASLKGRITFPTWRLYAEYLKLVRGERLSFGERMRCYGVLSHWWATNWNAARAAVDVLAVVAPSAPGLAEDLKVKLFGAAPGHFLKERR